MKQEYINSEHLNSHITSNDNSLFTLKAKINDFFRYEFSEHVSVGYTCSYILSNSEILTFVDKTCNFNNPSMNEEAVSGSDEATCYFIFKASKQGETIITFNHEYRGDIENYSQIIIIVE